MEHASSVVAKADRAAKNEVVAPPCRRLGWCHQHTGCGAPPLQGDGIRRQGHRLPNRSGGLCSVEPRGHDHRLCRVREITLPQASCAAAAGLASTCSNRDLGNPGM